MHNQPDKTAVVSEQFNQFFTIYDDVAPFIPLDAATKVSIEHKREWIHKLKQEEFPVAFLGSFSAGKSTIINGIIGREILPEATQSTTAFPTLLRRGERDGAVVYYINNDDKNSLWDQLSAQIGRKIDENLKRKIEDTETHPNHLQRIEQSILEYEHRTSSRIDRQPLNMLKQLLQGWLNYGESKNIDISDLKKYVEGHEDALFIDKIEAEIKGIDIPIDVVLVDLPGLAVVNERHIKFTKDYIQGKAKAFVVCMKPKHLLEGDEIRFLQETNRSNPTILQRAFWLINQWDSINEQQKQDEEDNFDKKIQQYYFSIAPDRIFKLSALNYLLLTCIANGTLDSNTKLKGHLDNLKKSNLTATEPSSISQLEAQNLLEHGEVKPFADFRKALFNYLNTTAKAEFISDAKSELLQIIRNIDTALKPLYDQYNQSVDLAKEFHTVEISKQGDRLLEQMKEKIAEFANQFSGAEESNFWKEYDTNKINEDIGSRLSAINREKLNNELRSGIDTSGSLSRLPSIVEADIKLTRLLREKLVMVIEASFIQRLNKLLLDLENINQEYLPDRLVKMLSDKLSDRDIKMRLNGLADALFYDYGTELDQIGLSLNECQGNTLEQRTEAALSKYKEELVKFARKVSKDINKSTQRSIKNHAEYLKEELLKLLKDRKDDIIMQITRTLKVSEAIAAETRKQQVIKSSYLKLVELRNQL